LGEVVSACAASDPEHRCSFEQLLATLSEPSLVTELALVPPGPPRLSSPMSSAIVDPALLSGTPRSATPDASPLPSPHTLAQQEPAALPQPGRRESWARAPGFLKRQGSDLHGFDDDHGVASEAKDGPGRLHEREASIRRHTQHLRTQQVARRRKSQDAVHGAVSFVTKLRRSSRSGSSGASSAASSEAGSERSESSGVLRGEGRDSASARDSAEAPAAAAAAVALAIAHDDGPRTSATAGAPVLVPAAGAPAAAQPLTDQERLARAIEEHNYNAPSDQWSVSC